MLWAHDPLRWAPSHEQAGRRKRRYTPPPQTAHESRRQAKLVQYAWRHFGDAAPMIAFLNARHEELEGRPLTLAIESDDGLARVEQLLVDLKCG